jgi:hypothetical protein
MKALIYIMILTTVILSSCATGLYVGGEYDDLYYSPSDEPVRVQTTVPEQIASGNLNSEQYYDNIYAKDTLIADEYNNAVDFDNSMFYNNNNSAFEYMDDFSYSNRLRRFYGNYFDPFWRDPFYYGYPSYGYGYGYDPFWSSRMYDPYGYGGFYGGYSGGYYGGYYGSLFSPYSYGNWGYYPGYYYSGNDNNAGPAVSRRSTYSTLSNNYNSASPSRKSAYQSGTGAIVGSRRMEPALQGQSPDRRTLNPVNGTSRQPVSTLPENRYVQSGVQTRRDNPGSSNQVSSAVKPEYKSVDRTYTPSYNNPRMSTRPSYNNTRTQSGANTNTIVNPSNSRIGNTNYNTRSNSGLINSGRSGSTTSPSQNRSVVSNSGRSESYSVPTRRDMSTGSGSAVQRSNYNSSSGSGSSGSGRSSSVSSGSSSSGSSSSGSSGSSSSRRK